MFFVAHYIINGGFAIVHRSSHTAGETLWVPNSKDIVAALRRHLPTPKKVVQAAARKVSNYGSQPLTFSLFFCCISPFVLLTIPNSLTSLEVMAVVYGISISLCCGLLLEVVWPAVLKPYFDLYWLFTLFYCLGFAPTLLFLGAAGHQAATIGLATALIVLVLCVDWKIFFMILVAGVASASVVYRLLTGTFVPAMDFDAKWTLYILFTLATVVTLLFARTRDLHTTNQLQTTKLLGGSIGHETNNYLHIGIGFGQLFDLRIKHKQLKPLSQASEEERKEGYYISKDFAEDIQQSSVDLVTAGWEGASKVKMFTQAMQQSIIGTQLARVSIKDCVETTLQDPYFGAAEVHKGLHLQLEDDFRAKVPLRFFRHIIYNLVKNAYHHGGATRVQLTLNKAGRTLQVYDNGTGIAADQLPYIFDLFYTKGGSGTGIGLALVKTIVGAFGGRIHCQSKQGEGSYTEFTTYFPELAQ